MAANRGQDMIEAEVEKMFAEALDEAEDVEYGPVSGPLPPAELWVGPIAGAASPRSRHSWTPSVRRMRRAWPPGRPPRRRAGRSYRGRKPKPPAQKAGHKAP